MYSLHHYIFKHLETMSLLPNWGPGHSHLESDPVYDQCNDLQNSDLLSLIINDLSYPFILIINFLPVVSAYYVAFHYSQTH